MAYSIITNIASLQAQQYLRVSSEFQSKTILRVTSGLRVVASADDAAGLSIANALRSDRAVLSQGVRNATDGLATLQVIDGGMYNISRLLDRARTLATQSASGTFTGDRTLLNREFQTVLAEIDRQSQSIGLARNGRFSSALSVFVGGGKGDDSSAVIQNGSVSVDLSHASVDTMSLGLGGYLPESAGFDLGDGSTTSVSAILTNAANIASEASAGHAGQTEFTFTGAGFSDADAVSVLVDLTGVEDLDSLTNAINTAIQSTAQTAGANYAAFLVAGITARIVTDAGGGESLAFGALNPAFQVRAGDATANALLGNMDATTGAGRTANPYYTGTAVPLTATGAATESIHLNGTLLTMSAATGSAVAGGMSAEQRAAAFNTAIADASTASAIRNQFTAVVENGRIRIENIAGRSFTIKAGDATTGADFGLPLIPATTDIETYQFVGAAMTAQTVTGHNYVFTGDHLAATGTTYAYTTGQLSSSAFETRVEFIHIKDSFGFGTHTLGVSVNAGDDEDQLFAAIQSALNTDLGTRDRYTVSLTNGHVTFTSVDPANTFTVSGDAWAAGELGVQMTDEPAAAVTTGGAAGGAVQSVSGGYSYTTGPLSSSAVGDGDGREWIHIKDSFGGGDHILTVFVDPGDGPAELFAAIVSALNIDSGTTGRYTASLDGDRVTFTPVDPETYFTVSGDAQAVVDLGVPATDISAVYGFSPTVAPEHLYLQSGTDPVRDLSVAIAPHDDAAAILLAVQNAIAADNGPGGAAGLFTAALNGDQLVINAIDPTVAFSVWGDAAAAADLGVGTSATGAADIGSLPADGATGGTYQFTITNDTVHTFTVTTNAHDDYAAVLSAVQDAIANEGSNEFQVALNGNKLVFTANQAVPFTINSSGAAAVHDLGIALLAGDNTVDTTTITAGTLIGDLASSAETNSADAGGSFRSSQSSDNHAFQWTSFTTGSQEIVFSGTSAGGSHYSWSTTLDGGNAPDLETAVSTLNTALQASGVNSLWKIVAVKGTDTNGGTGIRFLSSEAFAVTLQPASNGEGLIDSSGGSAGGNGTPLLATASGSTAPLDISDKTAAQRGVTALAAAVSILGQAQAVVGRGQNVLSHAINLAQSQMANMAGAESRIRDADLAAEAANLTRAQILTQAGISALVQANLAPNVILTLLRA